MWKIDLPLRIAVSKSKMLALNLNIYRNTHFHVLNKAKVNFAESIRNQLLALTPLVQVSLVYVIYVPTQRRLDISNVCCIVDKFFCDALVDAGIIPDDSYDHLRKVEYVFGGMDRENPRIEVFIKPEEPDMRIILSEEDLQQAAEDFVNSKLTIAEGQSVTVVLSEKVTAEVIIGEGEAAQPTTKKAPAKKAAAKKAEVVEEQETPEPKEEEKEEEATEADAAEEATEEAEETPPATAKKSLFGGLQRPKN